MSESERSFLAHADIIPKDRIIGPYVVEEYIGHGGYSTIYKASDPDTRELLAIKLEPINAQKKAIEQESQYYKMVEGSQYFPKIFKIGSAPQYHYIAMELLGPSLSQLAKILPTHSYSIETTIRLSRQMLCAIIDVHQHGLIHRDIKPGNFLIRADATYPIVLIDFGLARKFRQEDGTHVEQRQKFGFAGTSNYAPLNAHEKMDLSRRDDLISWFYSVLELINGKLPWTGLSDKKQIEDMKRNITVSQLCSSLPEEYRQIYVYISNLQFDEDPNYEMMLSLINRAAIKAHCDEKVYEWYTIPQEKIKKVSKINLIPAGVFRPKYQSAEPEPAPITKLSGYDNTIIPPGQAKKEKKKEDPSLGLKQLDVGAYRVDYSQDPFATPPRSNVLPVKPKRK